MPAAPAKGQGSRKRLLLVAAGLLALVAVFLLARRSAAAQAAQDNSGRPGPDLSGSAAQQPSGGAAGGDAGQLPAYLVSHPDTVQQQVQQTDTATTTTVEAPTASSAGYAYVNPSTAPTVNGQPTTRVVTVGGRTYEQTAPGSDYYAPTPPQTGTTGNVHTPGLQI